MTRHQLEHEVAAGGIDRPQALEVAGQHARLEELIDHDLVEGARVEVRRLLERQDLGHVRLVHDHVAEPEPRREDLREGPEQDHPVAVVERLDRRGAAAAVVEVAVGIVLEDRHAMAARDVVDRPLARLAHAHARRVLEARDGVDELGPHVRQHRLQGVGAHALLVHRHRHVVGLVRVEGLQRPEEGRVADDDLVARVEEELGDHVERLLRSRGDQDLALAGGDALLGQVGRQQAAQRTVALRRTVLQ